MEEEEDDDFRRNPEKFWDDGQAVKMLALVCFLLSQWPLLLWDSAEQG